MTDREHLVTVTAHNVATELEAGHNVTIGEQIPDHSYRAAYGDDDMSPRQWIRFKADVKRVICGLLVDV